MKLDAEARYIESHEWVREVDGQMVSGITDHAQDTLSDVVYAELPEVGDTYNKGESFGVVESVKAASDLYMPMGGEIVAINDVLEVSPELINQDPYGEGWMIRFVPTDLAEFDELLDAEAYQAFVAAEEG